uniref:Uncharacterized protein n=1 Tax=Oryza sativa subsp. japonica TaxID=39947 RepID=Q6EQC0_ORYSJ|nr:hypothetical protein [Oryza sativa Japonica Group]BAD29150.1 hypothetical protein [Oryza sativa Japonica Group]
MGTTAPAEPSRRQPIETRTHVQVRAPEADDQHALYLPKIAVLLVIVVAPQPRVDCVKDTAPAVQVPHPFQQNNKKPSGVSVTGPSLPSARISA